MNSDQIALLDRSGELARLFHEVRRRRLKEPGPDRPWFFHPLGYWIDVGYNGQTPEYDQPTSPIDPRTANFAQRMGALARTTKIWEDKEAMVDTCLAVIILGYCPRAFAASFGLRIPTINRRRYERCAYTS